jgi:hypothetical protein
MRRGIRQLRTNKLKTNKNSNKNGHSPEKSSKTSVTLHPKNSLS